MCDYCYFKENGDSGDNYKFLMDKYFKTKEKIFVTIGDQIKSGNFSVERHLLAHVWRDAESGKYELSVNYVPDKDDNDEGVFLKARIKYCPMCGAKL